MSVRSSGALCQISAHASPYSSSCNGSAVTHFPSSSRRPPTDRRPRRRSRRCARSTANAPTRSRNARSANSGARSANRDPRNACPQPFHPAGVADELLLGEVDGVVGLEQPTLARRAALDPLVDLGADPRRRPAEPRQRPHPRPVEPLGAQGMIHQRARRQRERDPVAGRPVVGPSAASRSTEVGRELAPVGCERLERRPRRGLERVHQTTACSATSSDVGAPPALERRIDVGRASAGPGQSRTNRSRSPSIGFSSPASVASSSTAASPAAGAPARSARSGTCSPSSGRCCRRTRRRRSHRASCARASARRRRSAAPR